MTLSSQLELSPLIGFLCDLLFLFFGGVVRINNKYPATFWIKLLQRICGVGERTVKVPGSHSSCGTSCVTQNQKCWFCLFCSLCFSWYATFFSLFLLVLIPVNYWHLCLNQVAQLSLCVHLFGSQILTTAPREPPFWSSGSLTVRAHGDFWPPALKCSQRWPQGKVSVGSFTLVLLDSNEEFTATCKMCSA